MSGLRVTHHLDRLEADLRRIPVEAAAEMNAIVREGIKVGNIVAKDFARESSGTHAKLYPGKFSAEMGKTFSGFGSRIIHGEYGPRVGGQGNLAPILENGSRHNKAHLNLARSADLMGPALAGEVGRMVDRLFW